MQTLNMESSSIYSSPTTAKEHGPVDYGTTAVLLDNQHTNHPNNNNNDDDDDDNGNYRAIMEDFTIQEEEEEEEEGSTWVGAAFNLTSSTVGAGCIGLGGAIANSGGFISIISILTFAILSKYSFDLVIQLVLDITTTSNNTNNIPASYEGLGYATYGHIGQLIVILSKGLYSYGCTIAYIKIIKDNFSIAALELFYNDNNKYDNNNDTLLQSVIANPNITTTVLCATIMLPLCLLRDLTPLERFSILKIMAVLAIVFIVIYLFFDLDKNDDNTDNENDFIQHWLTIRGGVWESLGTFVFTFVAHHTIHLVFQSLQPSQRDLYHFGKTTTLAVIMATLLSLLLGLFVYMTFWQEASSDIFQLYPPSNTAIHLCRLFLCTSMLLTYPFPFLTVRELFILVVFSKQQTSLPQQQRQQQDEAPSITTTTILNDTTIRTTNTTTTAAAAMEPLMDSNTHDMEEEIMGTILSTESWLVPGSTTQLQLPYHVPITIILWMTTLLFALKASSLGAVLNLTGCALGTVISYILPSLFSYKLRGHTLLGTLLFVLGGGVGLIGTYYSILALW